MWISRRGLGLALIGSLLLNGLLIGVGVGRYLANTRGPMLRHVGALVPPGRVRALPEAERERYRAATTAHEMAIAAARARVRAARAHAEEAIAASAFDRATTTDALANLRDATGAMQATIHETLVDALEGLSPGSRAALVARVERQQPPDQAR